MGMYTKSEGSWYEATRSYIKLGGEWVIVADGVGSLDKIPPTVTVSAPAGISASAPTYFLDGSTYRVQGTVMDGDSGVMGVYVNGQLATLNNENWYYDLNLTANTTTKIVITAIDNKGNESDPIERYVVYDNAAPSLAVSAPTGTSSSAPTFVSSASYTIQGSTSDANGIKSLTVNGKVATIGSDGSWAYSMTLTANTSTAITIVATDNAGRTATVTRYVHYDTVNPTISVSAPTGTSTSSPSFVVGTSITVSGTISDAAGIKSVTVNGSAATISGNSFSKTITGSVGLNTITIVATDNSGRTTTATRYVECINSSKIFSDWDQCKLEDDNRNGTRRCMYSESYYFGTTVTFYFHITSISGDAKVNLAWFDTDTDRWHVGKTVTTAGIHKVQFNIGPGYFNAAVGLRDAAAGYETGGSTGAEVRLSSGASNPSPEKATVYVYYA